MAKKQFIIPTVGMNIMQIIKTPLKESSFNTFHVVNEEIYEVKTKVKGSTDILVINEDKLLDTRGGLLDLNVGEMSVDEEKVLRSIKKLYEDELYTSAVEKEKLDNSISSLEQAASIYLKMDNLKFDIEGKDFEITSDSN